MAIHTIINKKARLTAAVAAAVLLSGGPADAGEGLFANNGSPAADIINDEIEAALEEFNSQQREPVSTDDPRGTASTDADSQDEQPDTGSTDDGLPSVTTTTPSSNPDLSDLQDAVDEAFAALQVAQTAMWEAVTAGDTEQLPALIKAYNEALSAWEEAGCDLGPTWEHWQWACAGGEPPPEYPTPTTPPTSTVPPTTPTPPPTTTQAPTTTAPPTTAPPTTTQPPATTVPPTTTTDPCHCLPPTDPEYLAAKAAWEAAQAAEKEAQRAHARARNLYLRRLVNAGKSWSQAYLIVDLGDRHGFSSDCDCDAETQAGIDEAKAAFYARKAEWKASIVVYNAALEEWDRVRDVSKVNIP